MKTSSIFAMAICMSFLISVTSAKPYFALDSAKEFGYAMLEFGLLWTVTFLGGFAIMLGVAKLLSRQ
ncbi:hypothetical protein G7Y31_04770 [Corynebacterium lizhenjunii]|uniref:Uncharacterized protein n=1 Tax=Corynebacterium lizhenjunii TaxID=2709394 RepID=A0A7T0PAL5_9CORY|nr:hypothetical protein [Corynebacterium lizhenjunii]QPK80008.1 hypothetical protein G7Y31_04770 [Corynebacterium lizhenjunii]